MPSERRKKYPDYLMCVIKDERSKWVTDSLVRNRRIALYGIDVAISAHGDKVEVGPSIPALSPLMKLIVKNPAHSSFQFKNGKWRTVR